jgi:hypothetical protein
MIGVVVQFARTAAEAALILRHLRRDLSRALSKQLQTDPLYWSTGCGYFAATTVSSEAATCAFTFRKLSRVSRTSDCRVRRAAFWARS